MMELRSSEKGFMNANGDNQLFGVDFHQFLEREKDALNVELASEFGLSLKEVKLLKKKMERS
ncbi:RNA polymerase subunit sigma-70 [Rossellomorea aquimaris]|jgi:hypothetical protein